MCVTGHCACLIACGMHADWLVWAIYFSNFHRPKQLIQNARKPLSIKPESVIFLIAVCPVSNTYMDY